jgi:hypothetical protein
MDSRKLRDAIRFETCWICGEHRGRNAAFVIGPMCAVNRVSAEPPSHLDCAVYSARRCPFLANPNMQRRDRGKPEHVNPAGVMITRNPGVALVWVTRNHSVFKAPGGVLFDVGDPIDTQWFAHGRPATRDEVQASIDSGLPALREAAAADGAVALRQLDAQLATALTLLPPRTDTTTECPA